MAVARSVLPAPNSVCSICFNNNNDCKVYVFLYALSPVGALDEVNVKHQLDHPVLYRSVHPYQSVQCVCVCIFCIVMLEPLSTLRVSF